MKIRTATKFDIITILEMIKSFASNTPIAQMRDSYDENYLTQLILHILAGRGVILLAEKNEVVIGMLIGFIDKNIWDPNLLVMNELAYWVEPEHRKTSAAYRLIMEYNRVAKEMVENNRISMFTMSKMTNSPDLDYGRFGYRKIEEHWVGGI